MARAGPGSAIMLAVASFRLFDIPVRVQPSFLLIALVLGWLSGSSDWRFIATWMVVIFVSILIHELGHALLARSYGADVSIELNGLGGLTRWSLPGRTLLPGRTALVAAAGSAAGLFFGGVVWVLSSFLGPFDEPVVSLAVRLLIFVNVFWGLLNWLPIRPLDGGHLMLSLLSKVAPRRADGIARLIFTVTSAAALFVAIRMGLFFIAALAGWMLLAELGGGQRGGGVAEIPEFGYDDDHTVGREDSSGIGQDQDPGQDPPPTR
jgi:Zn-dependent protease